jgi:hypothetical protein
MIKTKDAIAAARALIGTPYKEMDCINLIKKVIRTAPGGVPAYTTAGTNALWDSYEMSAKYKDLTWRQTSIQGARAGMIAFKLYGLNDVGHAGIVTGEGTVIHASSAHGRTVETILSEEEGWDLLGVHRYIEASEDDTENTEVEEMTSYQGIVSLKDPTSTLNVRTAPDKGSQRIGRLSHGAVVTVQAKTNDWLFVSYGDGASGYVMAEYVFAVEDAEEEPDEIVVSPNVVIIDDEGNVFKPQGSWRVLINPED